MNLKYGRVVGSLVLLTAFLFGGLLSNRAVSAQKVPQGFPQVFTFRYLVFIAEPKKADPDESKKRPKAFEDLSGTGRFVLSAKPTEFLDKLQKAEPNYEYRLLFAGSVQCNDKETVTIVEESKKSDRHKATLKDEIYLEQNSPTTVFLRHTGEVSYVPPDGKAGEDVRCLGWTDGFRDKVTLGRTHRQGVIHLQDGGRLMYVFSIHKGLR